MYGLTDLKPKLEITQGSVECPVLGCRHVVERQRRHFLLEERFTCPDHRICISPSTWEYPEETDNLLWTSPADRALLKAIGRSKRESRMARDNSEDAVTFNVFRYLERRPQLLAGLLSDFDEESVGEARLVFWSHDALRSRQWEPLRAARRQFGEHEALGSEPDLIAVSEQALFFIEAKFASSNNVTAPRAQLQRQYVAGREGAFDRLCAADWETIAIKGRRYELLRLWLLGSWLAERLKRRFCLVNILPAAQLRRAPQEPFGEIIHQSPERRFVLRSWEQIREVVTETPTDAETALLIHYFQTKTRGYRGGRLQPAFQA